MSKSLAELRSSTHTSLPERSYPMCLSQSLVAEVQALEEERAELLLRKPDADDADAPPRRQGETPDLPDPRLAEIDKRMEILYEEMREHTGELRLRAVTGGEWRRWVDAHPARSDGQDSTGRAIINSIDVEVTYGYTNAVSLLASLGDYAYSWNGDKLDAGDWDFIRSKAAAGDMKELCKIVVQMHELGGAKAPLAKRKTSSSTPSAEPVFN